MTFISQTDYLLEIAKGNVAGHSSVNKFGHNSDIDTTTTPETIWDGGGLWVPPTQSRIHDIKSTSVEDAGTLVSTGTVTTTSTTQLIDTGATFITDGVAVGDAVIDDTGGDHSYVTAVESETVLSIAELHHDGIITSGNTYRIATSNGTGCYLLHVKKALITDGTQHDEYIIMNGTTNVPTVGTYWRISRLHSDGAGSNERNVGDITATAQTDGTVTAQMSAGEGQTLMALDTIPAGMTGYLYSMWASITRDATRLASAEIIMETVPYGPDNPFGSRIGGNVGVSTKGNSYVERVFSIPVQIPSLTDIMISCTAVTENNVKLSAGFDLILVED